MDMIIPKFRIIKKAERDRKNIEPRKRKRKYELLDPIEYYIPMDIRRCNFGHIHPGTKLNTIFLEKGFTWDGASGPAIDTATFLVPSAVHDAVYFLIKNRFFDSINMSKRMKKAKRAAFRKLADIHLMEMCLAYGMRKFRAWYVYYAVRIFGGLHMKFN